MIDKIKRVICSCTNREMTKSPTKENEYFCDNCSCRVSIEFEEGEK